MIRERDCPTISGWLMLPALLIGLGLSMWQLIANIDAEAPPLPICCGSSRSRC
jgi:hypothetical protein